MNYKLHWRKLACLLKLEISKLYWESWDSTGMDLLVLFLIYSRVARSSYMDKVNKNKMENLTLRPYHHQSLLLLNLTHQIVTILIQDQKMQTRQWWRILYCLYKILKIYSILREKAFMIFILKLSLVIVLILKD